MPVFLICFLSQNVNHPIIPYGYMVYLFYYRVMVIAVKLVKKSHTSKNDIIMPRLNRSIKIMQYGGQVQSVT